MAYIGKTPTAVPLTSSDIAADIINNTHIGDTAITGFDALATAPADTDEFLISDAGTLKRIDASLVGGGGITVADNWRVTSAGSVTSSEADITANWEQVDTTGQGTVGSAMTESSGVFTFPSTGIYLVTANVSAYKSGDSRYVNLMIKLTTNNSSYVTIAEAYDSIKQAESSSTYANPITSTFIDVTDTSNVKIKFAIRSTQNTNYKGSTSVNENSFTFLRLGDT